MLTRFILFPPDIVSHLVIAFHNSIWTFFNCTSNIYNINIFIAILVRKWNASTSSPSWNSLLLCLITTSFMKGGNSSFRLSIFKSHKNLIRVIKQHRHENEKVDSMPQATLLLVLTYYDFLRCIHDFLDVEYVDVALDFMTVCPFLWIIVIETLLSMWHKMF